MTLLSSSRSLSSSLVCAALVACAGTADPGPPTVVRTPAPQGYEKTIGNYLAFRIRGSQKNSEIKVSAPEPGDCPLDGYLGSSRGWVVPVVYATRTGEATGRETIKITTRQYYFWFLGNTIAGITPRIELCPGIVTVFGDEAQPFAAASALPAAAVAAPARPEAERREGIGAPETSSRSSTASRAKAASGQKHGAAAPSSRKAGTSASKARRSAPKARKPAAPAKPELKW